MTNNTNPLAVFDTESQSERGAWLHLVTPGTDELAYADDARKKPLRIKLKGPESDTWATFQRKVMQQQDGKKDKRSVDEIKREDARLMARMTLAVENIPGVDMADKETITSMYENYRDIRVQALTFVLHRENFIGTGANG